VVGPLIAAEKSLSAVPSISSIRSRAGTALIGSLSLAAQSKSACLRRGHSRVGSTYRPKRSQFRQAYGHDRDDEKAATAHDARTGRDVGVVATNILANMTVAPTPSR
jgi:hypothetical protein